MISYNDIKQDKELLELNIKLYDSLKKLSLNTDFILVFKEYYCKDYVLQLVSKLNEHSEDTTEYRDIVRQLSAISSFQNFISNVITNGAMARQALSELLAIPESEIIYD